jgi:hypothetical protein
VEKGGVKTMKNNLLNFYINKMGRPLLISLNPGCTWQN